MLQGKVGGKDGEHRHRGGEGWKSHDQNAVSFPSVRMLFAGMVSLKCILILLRFSYSSSTKRRMKPELADGWKACGCAALRGESRGLLCLSLLLNLLEKSLFFCKPNLAWGLVASLGSGVCWHSVSRACGCGPEGFAQDNLEDVWPEGALNQCYPTGRARAIGAQSLAQCTSVPPSLLQHHLRAKNQWCSRRGAGSWCSCHCVPDLLINRASPNAFRLQSLLAFQAQTKLPLKLLNWWKELRKCCIHLYCVLLHWSDKWGYDSPYKHQCLLTHSRAESWNSSQAASLFAVSLFLLQWALNILQSRRIQYPKSEFRFILQIRKQNKGHIPKYSSVPTLHKLLMLQKCVKFSLV